MEDAAGRRFSWVSGNTPTKWPARSSRRVRSNARKRSKRSMQRRAGEPELRDLLGGRERKLPEIGLGFAHVLRQPRLVLRPQQKDRARRLEAESGCATEDHRWLE